MVFRRRLQDKRSRLERNVRAAAAAGRAIYDGYRVAKDASGMWKDIAGSRPGKRQRLSTSTSRRARVQRDVPKVNADYRRTQAKYGKRKSPAARAKKLIRQNVATNTFGFRHFGAWNRGNGEVMISSIQEGIAGTTVKQPVHLIDLTCVPQMELGSLSTIYYPGTHYELTFSDETDSGSVVWTSSFAGGVGTSVQGNLVPSGSVNKEYTMYPLYIDNPNKATTSHHHTPGGMSYIEKFRAQLILNTPKQKGTKWCIQLVSFSPEVIPGAATTQLQTAFWQAMARSYGYSPLAGGLPKNLRKYMKVYKTLYITQDAPESSEDHLLSRIRHVDFFGYLNRKVNYCWGQEHDLVNLDEQDVNEFTEDNETNQPQTHAHPRARRYIMIRALTTFEGPSATEGTNNQPSYDIRLSVTHRQLD
jgi:hypothetical protein